MTGNPVPRPSFGRALGEAARKLTKLHRQALTESGSDFPTWMLFTLLSERAAPIPIDEVVGELDRRMDLARPDTIDLLERTAADGFITYDAADPAPAASLTEAGSAHFASMYARSREATDAAVAGIDPESVETAVTVLLAIDSRATSLLGSAR